MMRMLPLLSACLVFLALSRPQDPSPQVLKALQSWRELAAPEKVYVLTDKDVYLAGETVWMAGFVVDGVTHWPGTPSALLYVDLVDTWGKAWLGLPLLVESGRASGQLALPADLPPGTYQLRAYTGRMRGFDEVLMFRRGLEVLNPGVSPFGPSYRLEGDSLSVAITLEENGRPLRGRAVQVAVRRAGAEVHKAKVPTDSLGRLRAALASEGLWDDGEPTLTVSWPSALRQHSYTFRVPAMGTRPSIRFFPEGGHMVAGLQGRVAFRVALPDGRGVPVSGRVVDDLGREAVAFATAWKGLGSFDIAPEAGRFYMAEIPLPGGNTLRARLPDASGEGLVLRADPSPVGDLTLTVRSPGPRSDLLLVVHRRGEPVFAARGAEGLDEFSAVVPADRLGDGVLHATVFDGRARPLAERLWFHVSRGDTLGVRAEMPDTLYGFRNKLRIPLEVSLGDSAALASLAVRVTEEGGTGREASLRCWLLLGSDLRGQVEDLCAYLSGPAAGHLDLLLLTHGWQRFAWEKLLGEVPGTPAPYEEGFTLRGRVLDTRSGHGLRNSPVTVAAGRSLPIQLRTDRDGRFELPGLLFPDSTCVLVQGDDRRGDRRIRFELDPVHTPAMGTTVLPRLTTVDATEQVMASYVEATRERLAVDRAWGHDLPAYTLGEVTVTDTRIREALPPSRLIIEPDVVIDVQDRPLVTGKVFDILQRTPSGFRVWGAGSDIVVRNPRALSLGGTPNCNELGCIPLILVDGMPTPLQDAVHINASEVAVIEVLKDVSAAAYGSAGFAGVISIVTRPGYVAERSNIHSQVMQGYALAREFYAPDYGERAPEHRKPDLRSTLWWQPVVNTDMRGRALVEFWTGDRPGRYLVHVEGLDVYGRTAEFRRWIEVK